MSLYLREDDETEQLGTIPQQIIDDVFDLKSAVGGLNFECTDVTFTFSNSSASAPVNLSTITNIPFEKIKYINFISFGMLGVFNGISNGSQYYCSNFTGAKLTQNVTAKCLIVYEL